MNSQTPVTIPQSPLDGTLLNEWGPKVRFQLSLQGNETPEEYRRKIKELLVAFVLWASPNNNKWNGVGMPKDGVHGGISEIWIGAKRFDNASMDVHDGARQPGVQEHWRGVMFYRHMNMNGQVDPIYYLSSYFERYLREGGIAYERYGRRQGSAQEILQLLE